MLPVIFPPPGPGDVPEWRIALEQWSQNVKKLLPHENDRYRTPEKAWIPSCFVQWFLPVWDRALLDRKAGCFRSGSEVISVFSERFTHPDSVLLWSGYPIIGFDNRNQCGFWRDLPGGLLALKHLVTEFHECKVHVILNYLPWDRGTLREQGLDDDFTGICRLAAEIGADGIFLDTIDLGPSTNKYRELADAVEPSLVLEPEGSQTHTVHIPNIEMSWAQFGPGDERIPTWDSGRDDAPVGILSARWFERYHMTHAVIRNAQNHGAELSLAWMNGTGICVWENVFGQCNPWSDHDRNWLKLIAAAQRYCQHFFRDGIWTPYVPDQPARVCAHSWDFGSERLITIVNRSSESRTINVSKYSETPLPCWDLFRGCKIDDTKEIAIPAEGYGALLFSHEPSHEFLAQQHRFWNISNWKREQDRISEVLIYQKTPSVETPRAGMIQIPARTIEFCVKFRKREIGSYTTPHDRTVKLKSYAIDRIPVTNRQFAEFIRDSGYRPQDSTNFLAHWDPVLKVPETLLDHPVVYVSLNDARAFAHWRNAHLPTEEQWQYAAQGDSDNEWPWGSRFLPDHCNSGEFGTTTPVDAYPKGASPFGVLDCCGNVWEWTESERIDTCNEFAIIRGGSYLTGLQAPNQPVNWYVIGGPQPVNHAEKILLSGTGLERCATIGFRCAVQMVE